MKSHKSIQPTAEKFRKNIELIFMKAVLKKKVFTRNKTRTLQNVSLFTCSASALTSRTP